MLKKSFIFALSIIAVVFLAGFMGRMVESSALPSSYDPGITIEKAFQSSKVPLLVEFYADSCMACRRMAPILHQVYQDRYTHQLTLVMMDIDDPKNQRIAQLFGVDELPAIYIFDFHRMKKYAVSSRDFITPLTLSHAIDQFLL